jgi:tetratricopeptide (TPR) repeat protein
MLDQDYEKPIIDFTSYMAERTTNFVGRRWVFEVINGWLAQPESRIFLLTGEPGSGKTALASRLHQFAQGDSLPPDGLGYFSQNFLSAIHFCSAQDSRWISPHVFTESIAHQLAQRYPAYAQALVEKHRGKNQYALIDIDQHVGSGQATGVVIKHLSIGWTSPEETFNMLIREPLEAIFRHGFDQQIVILVDALDEALQYSGNVNIVSLLGLTKNIPLGVRFLLTSRQNVHVENEFSDADGLSLSAHEFDQRNREDIRAYIHDRLNYDHELASKVATMDASQVSSLTHTYTEAAEENFQYARFLLDAIARAQQLTEVKRLPQGLSALYLDWLRRVVKPGSDYWLKECAPVLGILSVAQEGLTFTQLQAFTGLSDLLLWRCLGDLRQFLEEEMRLSERGELLKIYRLYHLSVIEFLRSRSIPGKHKQLFNGFYLSEDEWHKQIVHFYRGKATAWEAVDWSTIDTYGLRHTMAHLRALITVNRSHQELYTLICKSYMREKYRRFGSHRSFALDIEIMLEVASSEAPPNIVQVIRGSLLQAMLGSSATQVPTPLLIVLTSTGEGSKAASLVSQAHDKEYQFQAYLTISKISQEKQEHDFALEVGIQALRAAEGIEDKEKSAEALGQLVPYLMKIEAGDEWKQVMKGISIRIHDYKYMSIVKNMIKELMQEKQIDQIMIIAELLDESENKAEILSDVSKLLMEANENDHAATVAMMAIDSINNIDKYKQEKLLKELVKVLLHTKHFEEALVVARRAEENALKASILGEIIQAGDIDRASETVKCIQGPEKGRELFQLSLDMAEIVSFDRALEVTETIQNTSWHVITLIALTQVLISLGRREDAVALAKRVLQIIELANKTFQNAYESRTWSSRTWSFGGEDLAFMLLLGDSEVSGVSIYGELAQTMFSLGDEQKGSDALQQALKFLEKEENGSDKGFYLYYLAVLLTVPKKLDEALYLAEAIEDDGWRLEALCELVIAWVKMGERAKVLSLAERLSTSLTGSKWGGLSRLHCLSDALIQRGDFDLALTVLMKIAAKLDYGHFQSDKEEVLCGIVAALAKQGRFDQALEEVERTNDQHARWRMLTQIAEALSSMDIDNFDQILAVVRFGKSVGLHVRAGKDAAMKFARRGEFDKVLWLIENNRDAGSAYGLDDAIQDANMFEIIKSLAESENFDQAIAVTTNVKNEKNRIALLQSTVIRAFELDEIQYALKIAESVEEYKTKTTVFTALARHCVQCGRYEDALKLVQKALATTKLIPDVRHKVDALSHISLILLQAGAQEDAIFIAQQILDIFYTLSYSHLDSTNHRQDTMITLGNIARELVSKGKQEQSLVIAETQESFLSQALILSEIALGLIQINDVYGAQEVVKRLEIIIRSQKLPPDLLIRCANNYLIHSEKMAILQMAVEAIQKGRESKLHKVSILTEMALKLAKERECERSLIVAEQALGIAEEVTGSLGYQPTSREIAFARAAAAFVCDFDKALALIDTIKHKDAKAAAFGALAPALALIGEREKAQEMAHQALAIIDSQHWLREEDEIFYLWLLSHLAEALATTGDTDTVETVVDRALKEVEPASKE